MKLLQLESELKAKQAAVKALLESTMQTCQAAVVKPATATEPAVIGRAMTEEERAAIENLMGEAKAVKSRIDAIADGATLTAEIERLTGGLPVGERPTTTTAIATRRPTLGQQFVNDERIVRFIKAGGHRGTSAWTTPPVEMAVLDESSGSGGALIVPDYSPGVIPQLFRPALVADLMASGSTESNVINYMKETNFTNGAAFVLEGATKPESSLVFAAASAPVRKVAHYIVVTEEMLEDSAQIRSIIDARLRTGLMLVEDSGLLNGDGIAPNLLGLMNLPGLTPDLPRGADSNADAMLKQATIIATTTFVMVDGFVIHPSNWQTVQLTKTAAGNYLGTGPWAAPQSPVLWGLRVAVTPSIAAGTSLVGAYATCAQVFRKGGIRVEASNSHSTFFVENKVAIRAEERLALAVYREAAFGKVTGLA